MQKRTTTQQLNAAITDKLLHITRAQKYNKTTHRIDAISPETFQESLDFLCESVFKDCIGWHYEFDIKEKQYIIEAGRMNGDSDIIVIANLCVIDGVSREDVEVALRMTEES